VQTTCQRATNDADDARRPRILCVFRDILYKAGDGQPPIANSGSRSGRRRAAMADQPLAVERRHCSLSPTHAHQ
jgi:hypothetical protein